MKKTLKTFLQKKTDELLFDTPIGGQWILFDYFNDRTSDIDTFDKDILVDLLPRLAIYPGDGNYSQYSKSQYVYEKIAKVYNMFPSDGSRLWNAMMASPYLHRREVQFYNIFSYYEHRQGCDPWEKTGWSTINWRIDPDSFIRMSPHLVNYFKTYTTDQDVVEIQPHNIPHILVLDHFKRKGLSRLFTAQDQSMIYRKYIEEFSDIDNRKNTSSTIGKKFREMSEQTPKEIIAYVQWMLGKDYDMAALPLAVMRDPNNLGDKAWLLDFVCDSSPVSLAEEAPLMV